MKIFQLNNLINDGKISENEAIDDLHVTLKKIGNDINLKKDIETIFGNKESKSNELTTNVIEIKTENQSNINSVHTDKINIETQQNDSFFLKDNSEIENNFPKNETLKKENTLKLDVEDNNFSDIEKRKEKTKDNNQLKKDESIKRRKKKL